ncbi:MAG: hypothetical protein HZC14_00610 [Candidatus Niyogibacteria bacterium]|nr:hypothetical protein [Candidatus Niyogibacteria bacterium]
MSREEFAKKIHWQVIIWLAGLANIVVMIPQLVQIIRTHNVEGLSLEMFVMSFLIQAAFSLEGYFTRNLKIMLGVGLAGVVSAMVIAAILYIRYFQ